MSEHERPLEQQPAGRGLLRAVFSVPERIVLATVDAVLASRLAGEVTARVVASPLVESSVQRALDSPQLERLVEEIVDSPAMERLVAQVIDSRLLDAVVKELLRSEELWTLVDEIAGSPAVTDAITQQGLSFADVMADELRVRSQGADAALERVVRRVLRRKQLEQQ